MNEKEIEVVKRAVMNLNNYNRQDWQQMPNEVQLCYAIGLLEGLVAGNETQVVTRVVDERITKQVSVEKHRLHDCKKCSVCSRPDNCTTCRDCKLCDRVDDSIKAAVLAWPDGYEPSRDDLGSDVKTVPSTGGPVTVPLACCGSMGTKHRRDCPVRHPDAVPREIVQDSDAPGEWRCSDCHHSFDSMASKLDVTCPKCGGIHVVKRAGV